LYNCKQKDREPLQNFVRRFMQQRSQIPEADDKTTIQVLIKGLTLGSTTSHLTRRKPKSIDEFFYELEEYIMSDEDHRRRVAERNEARQGKATQEQCGDLTFKTHETSITWKIHNSHRTTDQTQEEVMHLGEEEGEEDPLNSQTITQ
jgi:hypothetical protein